MKDKIFIFFGVIFLFSFGCSDEEGNRFHKFLSKAVENFSPKAEKADIVNLLPAAENKENEQSTTDKEAEESKTGMEEDTLETIEEALLWEKIYYNDRGKPDPFRPLLQEREEIEKKVNVDLAELVGIIWGKNGYLALLKEGNLGYVLKEDDRVIDGKVFKITEDSITFLLMRYGEQSKVTLRLKKEEER